MAADPKLRQITDAWHDLGPFRVCAHWVEFDAPIVDGGAQVVPLAMPDGTTRPGSAEVGADGQPVPTRLRSYVGLVLEVDGAQIQVRGRIRRGPSRLSIELAEFPG